MGGVSFYRPASRSFRVCYAKGYAAFFTLPIHNFWLYLVVTPPAAEPVIVSGPL